MLCLSYNSEINAATNIFFIAYSSFVNEVGIIDKTGCIYLSVKSVFIITPFNDPDPLTSLIILGNCDCSFLRPEFKILYMFFDLLT